MRQIERTKITLPYCMECGQKNANIISKKDKHKNEAWVELN